MTQIDTITEAQLTPVERALLALREAQDALEAARLDLHRKVQDAFAAETIRIDELVILLDMQKEQLIAAIGANGPLPATARSAVGWAHYSSAVKLVAAEPSKWRAALDAAGLSQLVPVVLTESVNLAAVDKLLQSSADFHKATEALITETQRKPVLKYGFSRDSK